MAEMADKYNIEVDDFMSLIYSGNKVFVYILLLLIFRCSYWNDYCI